MAGKKKPCIDAVIELEPESDSEESSLDSEDFDEEVQVDFEGRNPTDTDRDGIKQLLGRLFLKAHIDRTEMAEIIIAQNYVGSVVVQSSFDDGMNEDDDDELLYDSNTMFGITTVINLTAKKDVPCIQQLRTYILQNAEKHATDTALNQFRDALSNETNHVGFLINERFINIPAKISVPLLENLYKEIELAKNKNMPFDFVHLLMIVKLYRMEGNGLQPEATLYSNQEEEIICQQAVASFEYLVQSECDTGMVGEWEDGEDDETLTPYRKIILFDIKNVPQLIVDITKFVNGE